MSAREDIIISPSVGLAVSPGSSVKAAARLQSERSLKRAFGSLSEA
jgi:hypothetical protein